MTAVPARGGAAFCPCGGAMFSSGYLGAGPEGHNILHGIYPAMYGSTPGGLGNMASWVWAIERAHSLAVLAGLTRKRLRLC